MEFADVLRRRRMVRTYDERRQVPEEIVTRIVRHGLRAPSAGFSQGWGFLVLDTPEDIGRFRDAVTPAEDPDRWFAAQVRAPLLIVPHANKDAYLDNYAQAHKGARDRSDDWWPAPYWDIDAGFASLLMLLSAVDAGLGACFFGIPKDRIDPYRDAFGVPSQLRPIGAISVGYPDEPPADLSKSRKSHREVVRYRRWNSSG